MQRAVLNAVHKGPSLYCAAWSVGYQNFIMKNETDSRDAWGSRARPAGTRAVPRAASSCRHSLYSRSTTAAAPMPVPSCSPPTDPFERGDERGSALIRAAWVAGDHVPMHMEMTPNLPLRRSSSGRIVAIWRAPVQPSGWPSAIAPAGGERKKKKKHAQGFVERGRRGQCGRQAQRATDRQEG